MVLSPDLPLGRLSVTGKAMSVFVVVHPREGNMNMNKNEQLIMKNIKRIESDLR